MSPSEKTSRDQIVEIGRLMYANKWVASNDGNISARLDTDRLLITPTGISKGMMRPEHLVVVDFTGRKLEGDGEPTSEMGMHLAIYQQRSDVGAVVHAHPPFATGFAVAGRALDLALVPEVVVNLGAIPLAQYGLPGTCQLTQTLLPLIPFHDAILLANHGAVTYGATLNKALAHMETLEHVARIAIVAETLGGPRLLRTDDVDKLIGSRSRYGVASHLPDSIRPISHEENEAMQLAGDQDSVAKVRLRHIIRSELELRFASLCESAGYPLQLSRTDSPQSRLRRALMLKSRN
ncbi:MAG: class II aldolase/adducin family protein [Terriglobia bacterium]